MPGSVGIRQTKLSGLLGAKVTDREPFPSVFPRYIRGAVPIQDIWRKRTSEYPDNEFTVKMRLRVLTPAKSMWGSHGFRNGALNQPADFVLAGGRFGIRIDQTHPHTIRYPVFPVCRQSNDRRICVGVVQTRAELHQPSTTRKFLTHPAPPVICSWFQRSLRVESPR